jgi:hypothetical protein
VARWNGADWAGLGEGLIYNAPVTIDPLLRLGSIGADLILAGRFDGVDNVATNNLARWDGTAWHALGSGTDGSTLAVLDTGQGALIGGTFLHAGSNVSTFIGRWNAAPGIEVERFSAGLVPGGVQLDWVLSPAGLQRIQRIRVERSASLAEAFAPVEGGPVVPEAHMAHVDRSVNHEGVYWYRLVLEHDDAATTIAGPYRVAVQGVFRTTLTISGLSAGTAVIPVHYALAAPGRARVAVYDVRGRLVRTLVDADTDAGSYVVEWSRDTHDGRRAPSGVYFVRLDSGGQASNAKIVLLAR